jgi:lipopolysaccharide biosynthesis glycosyltransferase
MSDRVLVFSLDDRYIMPFKVFMHSLVETNSISGRHDIYILSTKDSFSSQGREDVMTFMRRYQQTPRILGCDELLPKQLPIRAGDHVSKATFFRLFIGSILPAHVQSVAYLDVDMLAVRSIRPFLETPLVETVAACDHCCPSLPISLFGSESGAYFNAGVLLIDLSRWRSENIEGRLSQILLQEQHRIRWWDQDVLNIAFQDRWQRLPVWNNTTSWVLKASSPEQCRENGVMIHFEGGLKPWHEASIHPLNDLWRGAYRNCFGADVDLVKLPHAEKFKPTLRMRLGALRRYFTS